MIKFSINGRWDCYMRRFGDVDGVSMSFYGAVLLDTEYQQLTGNLLKHPPGCFAIIYIGRLMDECTK